MLLLLLYKHPFSIASILYDLLIIAMSPPFLFQFYLPHSLCSSYSYPSRHGWSTKLPSVTGGWCSQRNWDTTNDKVKNGCWRHLWHLEARKHAQTKVAFQWDVRIGFACPDVAQVKNLNRIQGVVLGTVASWPGCFIQYLSMMSIS